MGVLTTGQIEKISTSAINMSLCQYDNIDPNINWNDKEPSWDGAIYLYEGKSHKKDFLEGKIPVQVKGTEVKRISNKFATFNIKLNDIRNYYHDGGVIFFVVEILNFKTYKIFYKILLPIDLKNLMDDIKLRGKKSKSIKIDSILNEKSKFDTECKEFLIHKHRQSVSSIEQAVSLDSVKNKRIEFICNQNPCDMINREIYFYTRDEYGLYIPIMEKVTLDSVSYKITKDLILDNKKYFDSYKYVKTEDRELHLIGDGLEYDITNNRINLKKSQRDIITRLKTLNFIEKIILPEKKELIKKELEGVEEQRILINRIINLCKEFCIDERSIKLSNMTINDENVLNILENIKKFTTVFTEFDGKFKPSVVKVNFFDYKLLLLCIEHENRKSYINYFEDSYEFGISGNFDGQYLPIGRFSILKDEDLISHNFDLEIVKKSVNHILSICKDENKEMLANQYNIFALESIKAWDITNDIKYLELASYIYGEFKKYLPNEILAINQAQIYIRRNNYLSEEITDELYTIKLNADNKNKEYYELMSSISILLNNIESFERYFENIKDKKVFMNYPIYRLYLDKK